MIAAGGLRYEYKNEAPELKYSLPAKPNHAEDGQNIASAAEKSSQKGTAQGTEIMLYALDQNHQQYISIPDHYPQSYSLTGQGYGKVNGESITISNGSIVPAAKTWYYHIDPDSGYWIGQTEPSGQEGEIIRQEYIYKDSSIVIDGKTVVFHVYNYALVYSEQIMKQYLNTNIKSDMTDYEKAETCCKFVAGYGYGTESTSYFGMIITGSGDCWASTNALQYLFQQLGIPAISRSASHDLGAGSGHYNVLAVLDGYYYIVDAGYSGTTPRKYSIKRLSSSNQPYVYSILSEQKKMACITDYYDFKEYGEKVIQIPREIDGYTITEIGNKAFYGTQEVEKIILPDTVKSIGDSAFAGCKKLQSIEIPDSVSSMGKAVFYNNISLSSLRIPASVEELTGGIFQDCQSLKEIIVDERNMHYCSMDGVLFDKSMETLISYPQGKTDAEYDVPEGVAVIGEWSFVLCGRYVMENYYVVNNGFQKIVLPKSLRTIEDSAFRYANLKEIQISYGITEISSYSFQDANIEKVTLPDSVASIEPYAFYSADIKEIILSNTLKTIREAAFAGNMGMNTTLPASVQSIGYGAFWLNYGWSRLGAEESGSFNNCYNGYIVCGWESIPQMEERAFYDEVSLGVVPDSPMKSYAEQNGIYYVYVNSDLKCVLREQWFDFKRSYFMAEHDVKTVYKGVQEGMTASPYNLKQGKDYTLEYDEKQGDVYVTGISYMAGRIVIRTNGSKPGSMNGSTSGSANGSTPDRNKKKMPAKGTVLKSGKTTYRVTKKDSAVAFVKTSGSTKSITIPKTVRIDKVVY